jgi:hypothetical protein
MQAMTPLSPDTMAELGIATDADVHPVRDAEKLGIELSALSMTMLTPRILSRCIMTEAKKDLREQITERIVASLESGVMPWRKGWSNVKVVLPPDCPAMRFPAAFTAVVTGSC